MLFSQRMSDAALLQIPLFQGDHWSKVVETKCRDLYEAKEPPFNSEEQSEGKKRKRGRLLTRMYEALRVRDKENGIIDRM